MNSTRKSRWDRLGNFAARLAWLCILVLHLGPLASIVRSLLDTQVAAERLACGWRIALLAASTALFACKILDVSWLRFCPGWRAKFVTILAFALLHVGTIDRATTQVGTDAYFPVGIVLFIGSTAGFRGPRRWLSCFARVLDAVDPKRARNPIGDRLEGCRFADGAARLVAATLRSRPSRAPPSA